VSACADEPSSAFKAPPVALDEEHGGSNSAAVHAARAHIHASARTHACAHTYKCMHTRTCMLQAHLFRDTAMICSKGSDASFFDASSSPLFMQKMNKLPSLSMTRTCVCRAQLKTCVSTYRDAAGGHFEPGPQLVGMAICSLRWARACRLQVRACRWHRGYMDKAAGRQVQEPHNAPPCSTNPPPLTQTCTGSRWPG